MDTWNPFNSLFGILGRVGAVSHFHDLFQLPFRDSWVAALAVLGLAGLSTPFSGFGL